MAKKRSLLLFITRFLDEISGVIRKPFFSDFGRPVHIGRGVRVWGRVNISIGNHVRIEDYVLLDAKSVGKSPGLRIGNRSKILRFVVLRVNSGFIQIGNRCSINSFCHLTGQGGLTIGDDVRIATHVVMIPANHRFDRQDIPIHKQGETRLGIIIEDDVWIGVGATILDGVTIGRGAVVAAGAVVNKTVEPYAIVGGVPARIISRRGSSKFS